MGRHASLPIAWVRTALAAAALAAAGPASACLPPLPGEVVPTEAEQVEWVGKRATDILYGVVVRGNYDGKPIRFKILHVYRGAHRAGEVLDVEPGWGLNPPRCILSPPPVPKGGWGVIYFVGDRPMLNFLGERHVRQLFDAGAIRSARAPR